MHMRVMIEGEETDVTFLGCHVCGHTMSSMCLQGNVTFVYLVTWSRYNPISPPPLSLLPPPLHLHSLLLTFCLLLFFLYLETNKFLNWEVTPKSCRYPISLQTFLLDLELTANLLKPVLSWPWTRVVNTCKFFAHLPTIFGSKRKPPLS